MGKTVTGREKEKGLLKELILFIPNLVRLLMAMIGDPRVKWQEKLFLLTTVLYVLSPFDFVPDFIPFMGQVDDVLLLSLVILRFLEQAGPEVVLTHWKGSINLYNLAQEILKLSALFLPRKVYEKIVKNAGYQGDVIDIEYRVN